MVLKHILARNLKNTLKLSQMLNLHQKQRFFIMLTYFCISQRTNMQNHHEITSKNKFGNQNVQFWYLHHFALSNSLNPCNGSEYFKYSLQRVPIFKYSRIFQIFKQSLLFHRISIPKFKKRRQLLFGPFWAQELLN